MFERAGRSMVVSLSLLLAPLAAAGCGGITIPTDTTDNPKGIPQLALEPGAAALLVGQTVQLRLASGSAGQPGPLVPGSWASSNPAVARVSVSGLVTGVSQGSATITLSSVNGQGKAGISVR